jgi:M6 family metalloprotease-like protein
MSIRYSHSALWAIALAVASTEMPSAHATEQPGRRAGGPTGELADRIRSYIPAGGFLNLKRIASANRAAVMSRALSLDEADSQGGLAVSGRKEIPVLLVKFADTPSDPYPTENLQRELFGSWPSGTMTDYYHEVSSGRFTIGGKVGDKWYKVSQPAAYYEGPVTANGSCNGQCDGNLSRLAELFKEALDEADKTIDFSQYDNDGADGIPNSGDDDGRVDFIAFVHAGIGGECGSDGQTVNNHIWAHQFSLNALAGKDYETNDLTPDGRHIRIDNYLIVPAVACDGRTMIEIGVFTHEFGHSLGLPDLYDTGRPRPRSQGIGAWGLMGAGEWGGDGFTAPHRPTHMSPWSKAELGWVNPLTVSADTRGIRLKPIETSADVLRVNVSEDVYYLIEYRSKTLFDDALTGPGVLVWRINEAVLRTGGAVNRVNVDPDSPGVYVVQADGKRDLDDAAKTNRGDAGDPFPGTGQTVNVDNTTNPATTGNVALCNITIDRDRATFDVRVTSGSCAR